MKTFVVAVFAALLGLSAAYALATNPVEHGGGCRKSSPPGQCCHKDHKTGIVHCH